MRRAKTLAIFVGIAGTAVLLGLGNWQLQRLEWKRGVLAEIAERIAEPPVPLPGQADASDRFRAVEAAGRILPEEIHVLTSLAGRGPGYRLIAAFETGGRRVLLDRGFIAAAQKERQRPASQARILGNLHWPDEVDRMTPAPDLERNIWFGRDVSAMARVLDTEPILIVAGTATGAGITPLPVTAEGIRNDHLQYAITWFALAAVWAGMTGYYLWRIRSRRD